MKSLLLSRCCAWLLVGAGVIFIAAPAPAAESRFHEAQAEGGELRLVDGVPVLIVQGTPEQIGRQTAALLAQPIKEVVEFPVALMTMLGRQREWTKQAARCEKIFAQAPADQQTELKTCAAAAGVDREKLVILNTILDVYGGFGCSSLIVEGRHSATGAPLFGRNMDFPLSVLKGYNIVAVNRPKDKHAFATIGFPGLVGAMSGINDQGLALAVHGVFASGGTRSFSADGVPCGCLYRRLLEQCATVEQAEKLLRESKHTTALSVVLCDRQRGLVVEVSPGGVASRGSENGLLACTNHFRAGRRLSDSVCPRYASLRRIAATDKISLADVAHKLNDVNQGNMTLQTMVFEPAALHLHLAVGACPSSALPLKDFDLAKLFGDSAPKNGENAR